MPPFYLRIDLVLLMPEHCLDGVVPHQRVRLDIPVPDDVRRSFRHELESLVRTPHRALGLSLLADVDHYRDRGDDLALVVHDRSGAHSDETVGAIPAPDADLFGSHRFLGDHRSRQRPLQSGVLNAVVVESHPLAIALQIWRRTERAAKDLCHLCVDRDQAPRMGFRRRRRQQASAVARRGRASVLLRAAAGCRGRLVRRCGAGSRTSPRKRER